MRTLASSFPLGPGSVIIKCVQSLCIVVSKYYLKGQILNIFDSSVHVVSVLLCRHTEAVGIRDE